MLQFYTVEEVMENNGKNGKPTWIIIRKSVYNVTTFLEEHPGGKEIIEEYSGKDATKGYIQAGHSRDADTMLKQHKIGELAPDDAEKKLVKKRCKFLFCI